MFLGTVQILVALYRTGDLSVSGLRRSTQWFCPCEVQRLRPRVFAGILLQAQAFLPFLPSEERGGIRIVVDTFFQMVIINSDN
jgi:hypothetical protein